MRWTLNERGKHRRLTGLDHAGQEILAAVGEEQLMGGGEVGLDLRLGGGSIRHERRRAHGRGVGDIIHGATTSEGSSVMS